MSGSIAPSAAARIGLGGTRSMSHSRNPGAVRARSTRSLAIRSLLARSDSETSALTTTRSNSGTPSTVANTAAASNTSTKMTSARHPTCPMLRPPDEDATPTMRLDMTSGMTVIRIALIQSVPTVSMGETSAASPGVDPTEIHTPAATPRMRPRSTRAVSDTSQSYPPPASVARDTPHAVSARSGPPPSAPPRARRPSRARCDRRAA